MKDEQTHLGSVSKNWCSTDQGAVAELQRGKELEADIGKDVMMSEYIYPDDLMANNWRMEES